MIEPYINFKGHANEAMEFYDCIFGGTNKRIMKYSDMPVNPDYPIAPEMKNWIGHARMTICGTTLNFSDTQPDTEDGNMISLAVYLKTPEEVSDIYHKLLEDGEILMELEPQFFAKMYAWVKDKFGVNWQLICE